MTCNEQDAQKAPGEEERCPALIGHRAARSATRENQITNALVLLDQGLDFTSDTGDGSRPAGNFQNKRKFADVENVGPLADGSSVLLSCHRHPRTKPSTIGDVEPLQILYVPSNSSDTDASRGITRAPLSEQEPEPMTTKETVRSSSSNAWCRSPAMNFPYCEARLRCIDVFQSSVFICWSYGLMI